MHGRLYRWREERAIGLALGAMPPGGLLLDAACGTGRVTALVRRLGFRAAACDISRAMIDVARPRLASLGCAVPFVETDAGRLPYQSRSVDGATCIGLLMHLDADMRVRVLRELSRVSRGPLVVQYGITGMFLQTYARVTGRMPGDVRFPITDRELKTDLARSGLIERARFCVLRPVSSSVILLLSA